MVGAALAMLRLFLLFCISLLCLPGAEALRFDVASIRAHFPDDNRFRVKPPADGRFSATGAVAKVLLMLAYDVPEPQITGGPNWFTTEKWDIEAKSDARDFYDVGQTRQMLQNLLAERFSLQVHRENVQRPAYVLIVAKGGPKFKQAEGEGSSNVRISGRSISLEHGELARMTQLLASSLGRPVVDRTGLSGHFNLVLNWDDAPVSSGGVPGLDAPASAGRDHGSIFTAIQQQLGLRLEPQRVAVEVIVVDRMEKPSQN